MTLYWWMHWFWITCYTSVLCHSILSTLHSNSTDLPLSNFSTIRKNAAEINPPINLSPPPLLNNNSQLHKEPTLHSKPTTIKIDLISSTPTQKSNITINKDSQELTVINENRMTSNTTESMILDNSNITIMSEADDLTFTSEKYNNSLISERIETSDGNEKQGDLSAAGITGITLGCVVIVGIICSISFFVYQNRSFNRPQVLNDRCSNPDSSGYIDDASVRDNSEEMYSLDNDSFLNSLEAMTIQNYWTDTVKHTKL